MNSLKEYRNSLKNLRKEFKKYRKSMWKLVWGIVLAVLAVYILPEKVLPALNAFLHTVMPGLYAASIVVYTMIGLLIFGSLIGVVGFAKSLFARNKVEDEIDLQEEYVENLSSEKERLLAENNSLTKEVENLKQQVASYENMIGLNGRTSNKTTSRRPVNTYEQETNGKQKKLNNGPY